MNPKNWWSFHRTWKWGEWKRRFFSNVMSPRFHVQRSGCSIKGHIKNWAVYERKHMKWRQHAKIHCLCSLKLQFGSNYSAKVNTFIVGTSAPVFEHWSPPRRQHQKRRQYGSVRTWKHSLTTKGDEFLDWNMKWFFVRNIRLGGSSWKWGLEA